MADISDRVLSVCHDTMHLLRHGIRGDDTDSRIAVEAIDRLDSGWGLHAHLPEPIYRLVRQALEAGYQSALADVRDGDVDGLGAVDDL